MAETGRPNVTSKLLPTQIAVSLTSIQSNHGRHYQRQHLSGVLVTFRQQLAAEFASRNCSYAAAAATE
jgi:hypothetical protein